MKEHSQSVELGNVHVIGVQDILTCRACDNVNVSDAVLCCAILRVKKMSVQ